ncbi:MAG TPA: helix-turn-helix domain-containing protein [Pilimelia sp.]|nr:helix-turn-helix domain-containing protein [Pilimelia sp.]
MRARTDDTRTRIRAVALDLFTAQGYEQTSLREIAERLGVTKAALYYHFRSKDEIVESILADRLTTLEQLTEWAAGQPPGRATRKEALRRYAAGLRAPEARLLVRFYERNQPALRASPTAARLRDQMRAFVRTLRGADADLVGQLRTTLAFSALHAADVWLGDEPADAGQRLAAALTVGDELLDRT